MSAPTLDKPGLRRRWSLPVAVTIVIVAYLYFASHGTFTFRRIRPEHVTVITTGFAPYYPALAEGFLHGRLDMAYEPDPRWKDVVNAYDFRSRAAQGLEWEMWDATYYRGRFYLYFSPLPVLLFYIPLRLLSGLYPSDAFVAVLASTWAFLMCVAFAKRALGDRRLFLPFELWVLLIGIANVVPYTLIQVRAYEVAIATGMAMTATWAYALLRWTETGAARHAVFMGFWLALAVATRPNLIVLVAITALVLIVRKSSRAMLGAALPLALIGSAVAAYNYARFGNVLELGVTYQISYEPMWRHAICSLCDLPDARRLINNIIHYLFWAPSVKSTFPFVELRTNLMDAANSFGGDPEPIGGIGALNPLVLMGSLFALRLARTRNATTAVMAAAWLVLFALATCWWVTARYSLDFMLLMSTASVVSIEGGVTLIERAGVRVMILRLLLWGMAVYAIALGVLLGFPKA